MSNLYIYGASDDLIEVEGIVSDELNPPYGKPATVAVRAGDDFLAAVVLDYDSEGVWRVLSTESHDIPAIRCFPARGEDEADDEHGCPGYSDMAVIDLSAVVGDITVSIETAA